MLTVEGAMNTNRHEFFQFLAASAVLTPAARACSSEKRVLDVYQTEVRECTESKNELR